MKQAYYQICQKCAEESEVCAKCGHKEEIVERYVCLALTNSSSKLSLFELSSWFCPGEGGHD